MQCKARQRKQHKNKMKQSGHWLKEYSASAFRLTFDGIHRARSSSLSSFGAMSTNEENSVAQSSPSDNSVGAGSAAQSSEKKFSPLSWQLRVLESGSGKWWSSIQGPPNVNSCMAKKSALHLASSACWCPQQTLPNTFWETAMAKGWTQRSSVPWRTRSSLA